jgi:thiol-disulfide isomerase/thioredoxin
MVVPARLALPAAARAEALWGPARVKVGEAAPDFAIRDMDGRDTRLSLFLGKTVLLSFWVSWCGECNEQADSLRDVFRDYHNRGLEIIGISYDTDRASAEAFRRGHGILWPIEFTGRGFWKNRIGRAFRVTDTGTILLINRDGILEGEFSDMLRLRRRLDQIIPVHTRVGG